MDYEQKIEVLKSLDQTVVQNRINQQNALGWEIVSSSVSDTYKGKIMTLTFKRNKNLKFYSRFVDLNKEVDKLRDLVVIELSKSLQQSEKDATSLTIQSIFSAILFFGLILLDLYIIIGSINAFSDFTFHKFISIVIYLAIAAGGHFLQRKWSKRIKVKLNDNSVDDRVKIIKAQIEVLIEEAKSIDHT